MIDPQQLRDRVVTPVLQHLGLWTLAAEQLVMGTAAQEGGLRSLVQLGGGPALGLWQMEPETHDDIWTNFLGYRPGLAELVRDLVGEWPRGAQQLATNLAYGAAMCRLQYFRDSQPLPAAGDVQVLARTWKRVYNTERGAGTVEEFIRNWRLVASVYGPG